MNYFCQVQKVPTTLFSGHFSHSSKFNFCSRGVNGVKKCWFKRSAEWNFLTLLSANSSLCRVYCTSEQYTYKQQFSTQWGQKKNLQSRIWISKHFSKKFSKPLLVQKNETSKMYPEIVKVLHIIILMRLHN